MPEPSNRGINFPEQSKSSESGGTMGTVRDKAQEMASSVASSAQQAWDTTRRQVQDAASNVGETFEDAFGNVNHFVRRYPLACVLGGFFVGFLAASAMGGMSSGYGRGSSSY